jgi:hypothetical protein
MKIIFCLPGSSFSDKFFGCWTELLSYCLNNGIVPIVSQATSCNIYYVRSKCLGGDVLRGKEQKPFDGKIDYDYIMWLDSDMVYNPQQFQKLLNHQEDVVSGLYAYEGGEGFTCGKLDEKYFKEKGIMECYTPENIKEAKLNDKGLLEVDYTGMGFLLIKKGILEKLTYPWFKPHWFKIDKYQDFSMEDVSLCMDIKEKGHKIFVDPSVRVGHEKKIIY